MGLTDEEMRDVLERAEEIQQASHDRDELSSEIAGLIEAAGQVGLTRGAVEQALRERLHLTVHPPAAGELVFAQSEDRRFYVAEVLSSSEEKVEVRFLRGSQHTLTPGQLRPLTFLPGQKVMVHWPWWGPWKCTVVHYDAQGRWVKLSDGWSETRMFPIAEVWLNPLRARSEPRRLYAFANCGSSSIAASTCARASSNRPSASSAVASP